MLIIPENRKESRFVSCVSMIYITVIEVVLTDLCIKMMPLYSDVSSVLTTDMMHERYQTIFLGY